MLKFLRTTSALLAIIAALAAPAYSAGVRETAGIAVGDARAGRCPARGSDPLGRAAWRRRRQAEKGTPEQQAFAHKVADAMASKDFAAMKQLVAPSTLKCIGKNEDFLQDRIKRQFALPISRKFNLKITKLPPNILNAVEIRDLPDAADSSDGNGLRPPDDNHDTVNLPIGQEDGNWYEAQPCPTEAGMVRFAKLQQMHAIAHERAKAAAAKVEDPVKSQLLALIGKHDAVSAWKLCMSSLHYDFPTCRGMVAILGGRPGLLTRGRTAMKIGLHLPQIGASSE